MDKTDDNVVLSETKSVLYNGPLPTSQEFAGYESAYKGAAERILVMAEKEAGHRHEMERDTNKKIFSLNRLGQILGFIALLLCIGSVTVAIVLNKPLGSIPAVIIAISSLVAMFTGRK
jgi:uncharacterized membrane protein